MVTASPQAVLESLACGGSPIYIQREDYSLDFQKLFKDLDIPIIKDYDKNKLLSILNTISSHKYPEIAQNSNKISEIIKENLNL